MHIWSNCYLLFLGLVLQCSISCNENAGIPQDVTACLKTFGPQEGKFKEVIEHFRQENDSFKLQACYFLIRNIQGLNTGKIDSVNNRMIWQDDVTTIAAKQLIGNIDDAVENCRTRLLNGSLGFSDFCEYVLPYRFDQEPLENWRATVRRQFHSITDSLKQHAVWTDTVLCNIFNKQLKQRFRYTVKGNLAAFKGWSVLSQQNNGNCVEMCKLITYPLRAYGVATTTDFTPAWANNNGGGHMWNVLITEGGKHIPFMGLEADPNAYNPLLLIRNKDAGKNSYHICGKVFRKTFSINKNSLQSITGGKLPVPDIFATDRMIDVTREYLPVGDITLQLDTSYFPKSGARVAYLGVFSKGQWQPTAWGLADEKGNVRFEDMAVNAMYIPVIYSGFSFMPVDYPLYLNASGKLVSLIPDEHSLTQVRVKYLQSKEMDQLDVIRKMNWSGEAFVPTLEKIADNKLRSKPVNHSEYTLYYWKDGWKETRSARTVDKQLAFDNIPRNGLYRLVTKDSENKERCFTMEDGEQRWW